MTTLLLVRHGETDWNLQRRWQGHADVLLNDRGRTQAEALAERLLRDGRVDVVYSSDLSRARETAEIVARRLGIELHLDPDLREIDVGSREGRTWAEIDNRPEWDGEPHEAHGKRVVGALERIAANHPDTRVLVVTHGGSMHRIQEHVGLDHVPIENCSVWTCAFENGAFRALD